MTIFISQGCYSQEALKSLISNPEDRKAHLAKICEQAGGRLIDYYITLGEYDWMLISDMPSHREISAVAIASAAGGGITHSKTIVAMTSAEAAEMFAATAKLAPSYRIPGKG